VNNRSSIVSVQLGLGQPGAPAIVAGGGSVRTENGRLPFLISLAGIAIAPATVIGEGFCPGGCVAPAGLVQVTIFTTDAMPLGSSSAPRRAS
jgi:hypothetical protein